MNVLYVGGKNQNISMLSNMDVNLDYVQNGMIALSAIQTGDFDSVIIEDKLPLMTPSRLIQELFSTNASIPLISIVNSPERRKTLLSDVGMGLFGYYEPDKYSGEELFSLLNSAKNFHDFKKQVPRTALRHFTGRGFEKVVGYSRKMLDLYHLMSQIKSKDVTTILYGESGTGKNLIASTLHRISLRRDRPNIAVNCPAIPSDLLESELFGHEKGAFTGAIERTDGKFLVANSGSIFLDEIGDMSPSLQAKILRVLESGEIERVGGAETIKVDVRIISATNQSLEQKIKEGSFRQDLYHRINVFPITVPPLRERKEDVIPTTLTILKDLKKKHKISVDFISYEGMQTLTNYDWPGNVRELENTLERILLIHDKPIIESDDINKILNDSTRVGSLLEDSSPKEETSITPEVTKVKSPLPQPTAQMQTEDRPIQTLKELEYDAIVSGLERTGWNMTTTAQQLGISRMTLYRKLEQHGLRKKD